MQIMIDTNKSLPEITGQLVQVLTAAQEKHHWDGLLLMLEHIILWITLSEWADKAPGSIGRLKRIHRAFIQPPQQS